MKPRYPRGTPDLSFRHFPKLFKQAVVAVVALASLWVARNNFSQDYNNIAVVKIYDGDTIQLANGEKVRFIGIDCPESHENNKLYADARRTGQDIHTIKAMGDQAYQFTRQLVTGRRVRLEFDREQRDRYGRLLAYVYLWPRKGDEELDPQVIERVNWVEGNGKTVRMIFLNATIVKAGFAQTMTIPPNVRYADSFREWDRLARAEHRGLWQGKDITGGSPGRLVKKPQ